MKFTGVKLCSYSYIGNVMCLAHLLMLMEISHFMYILEPRTHDIPWKFHMSYEFTNFSICDIYWTFPLSTKNFTSVHFLTKARVKFTGHFLYVPVISKLKPTIKHFTIARLLIANSYKVLVYIQLYTYV